MRIRVQSSLSAPDLATVVHLAGRSRIYKTPSLLFVHVMCWSGPQQTRYVLIVCNGSAERSNTSTWWRPPSMRVRTRYACSGLGSRSSGRGQCRYAAWARETNGGGRVHGDSYPRSPGRRQSGFNLDTIRSRANWRHCVSSTCVFTTRIILGILSLRRLNLRNGDEGYNSRYLVLEGSDLPEGGLRGIARSSDISRTYPLHGR